MTKENRKDQPLARLSYLLFLPSMLFWLYYSVSHWKILVERLADKGLPAPQWLYGLGFVLWGSIGVPYLLRIRRKAHTQDDPYPLAQGVIPLLLFLSILVVGWLTYFNFVRTQRTLFLELHFLGPFLILWHHRLISRKREPSPAPGRLALLLRKHANTLVHLSLLLTSLLLFTMVAEFLFRTATGVRPIGDFTDLGRRYDFVLSPYVMFAEPDKRHGGDLNAQGFTGEELPPLKKTNQVRVAILGGSAVWSGRETSSIAAYLERDLKERFPEKEWRVINWGRQSYISMQELILLQRNVLPLSFDVVIVYNGYNDLFVPMFAEPEVGYPYLYSNLKYRSEVDFINLSYVVHYLASKSAILHSVVKPRMGGKVNRFFDLGKCIEEYGRNLFQMALLAEGHGTKILFCVQPYIGRKKRTPAEQKLIHGDFFESMEPAYAKLIEAAKEGRGRTGAIYLDTVSLFRENDKEIFYDRVHIDPKKGNPVVARYIADCMADLAMAEKWR